MIHMESLGSRRPRFVSRSPQPVRRQAFPSRFAALGATIDAVTVYYRTLTSAGAFFGTAADDYAAIPETAVVFAEGESEKMVPVNLVIRGDNILCTIRLLAPGSKAGCFWEQTLNETKGNLQLS